MRSVDDARAQVHREARRRQLRNQLVLGAGVATLAALALLVLAIGVIPTERTTELSSDRSTRVPEASTSTSRRSVAPSDPDPPAAGAPLPTGSTSAVDGEGPTAATSSSRRPTATRPQVTAPRDPATTTERGSEAPDPGAGVAGGPSPPPPSGPVSTTIDTGTTGATTTTTSAPRTCTSDDFGATDIGWASGTGQPFPERTAPAGEPSWFVVSVWAEPGTPCLTRSWGEQLTVTDADGDVVVQQVHDEGPGRLTEPGRWVVYDAWMWWDPSCAVAPPEGWTTPACVPVGAGSYVAHLTVAGTELAPLAVTIARH